jgi:hypothetical protein
LLSANGKFIIIDIAFDSKEHKAVQASMAGDNWAMMKLMDT